MSTPPAQSLDLANIIDFEAVQAQIETSLAWARSEALSWPFAAQLAAVAIAMVVAFALKRQFTALIALVFSFRLVKSFQARAIRFLAPSAGPALGFLLLSFALFAFQQVATDAYLVRTAANLVGAWAAIRLLSNFIAEPFWARTAATTAWVLAALNILGWLDPAANFLDGLGMAVGEGRISALTVLRAIIVLSVLYWVASWLSRQLGDRVEKLPSLNPSARILLTKSAQIALIAGAFLIGLSSLGVNISALAIFGGAIGLGIGFGLQKIFSNLVSGVILLLDRSIKPGDVITLEDTYGRVSSLGMRFAAVITRDGHEHLIPNEEFITTKVINWSFSNKAVRIKRMIGVSYDTDVPRAQQIIVDAAESVERVLRVPKTRCLLRGFGDNSIELEVRFWISDPQNGVNNVTSDVLVAIWKAFQENGVEFPFPQRDIHIREAIPVRMESADSKAAQDAASD